jgi:hypothetical protein
MCCEDCAFVKFDCAALVLLSSRLQEAAIDHHLIFLLGFLLIKTKVGLHQNPDVLMERCSPTSGG